MSRSSPAFRSRRISPPSGTRPSSRAFTPKAASIGKAILFPQAVEALGDAGTTSPRKSGGRRAIRSSPRSTGQPPVKWRAYTAGDRPAVDPADRLCPCAVRAGRRRDGPGERCRRWRRRRRGDRGVQPSTPSSARSPLTASWAAAVRRPQHLQDAAGRRPVAAEGRRRLRSGHRRQSDQPSIPTGGTMEDQLSFPRRPAWAIPSPGPAFPDRPSRAMSILALKNVSKSFGALKVTDDVSFEVPEGRRWASSGPTGRASRRCSI
jgi:hypothetical protein